MKSLFFVAVAVGILSGTTISAKAQTSVNIMRFGDKTQPKFIEGIEFKRNTALAVSNTATATPAVTAPAAPKKAEVYAPASLSIEVCTPLQFKYAMLMDVEVELIRNFTLFNFIEEWWSVRYRYGGTTKKGVDCSAYTGHLLSEVFGLSLPRTAREQFHATQRVMREDLLEGDLVFFNTRGGISHVGVYLGNGYFTHSSSHGGVTISSLNDPYYDKRYIGGGRVNEPVTDGGAVGE